MLGCPFCGGKVPPEGVDGERILIIIYGDRKLRVGLLTDKRFNLRRSAGWMRIFFPLLVGMNFIFVRSQNRIVPEVAELINLALRFGGGRRIGGRGGAGGGGCRGG